MISIIVSSYRKDYLESLKTNIERTIGEIVYELIPINNPGAYGICEAYNRGAAQAKYPILCFVHEDVLFRTLSWGAILVKHFDNPEVGVLGIAGSAYKSRVPSTWSVFKPYVAYNLIQHLKNGEVEQQQHSPISKVNRYQVVSLDGVFMATKKHVWNQYPFDEDGFTGFHGYDMDFSMQVAQRFKNYVVFDILIEHFSSGNPDKGWLKSAMYFSRKWKQNLPFHCYETIACSQKRLIEKQALKHFIKRSLGFGYSKMQTLYFLWKSTGKWKIIEVWRY